MLTKTLLGGGGGGVKPKMQPIAQLCTFFLSFSLGLFLPASQSTC